MLGRSLGTLMRVSRPVCLGTRCGCPGLFGAVPRAEELGARKVGGALVFAFVISVTLEATVIERWSIARTWTG